MVKRKTESTSKRILTRAIFTTVLVAQIALQPFVAYGQSDSDFVPRSGYSERDVADARGFYNQLLSRDQRPTVLEALDTRAVTFPYASLRAEDIARLHTMILSMETLYPNLTYVMLGRDSAYLADLVDAFYTSRGHPGRVVRMDLSRASVNYSPAQLSVLLRQHGFRLGPDGLERPFIIFDRTEYQFSDYNHTSQALRLVAAGYEAAAKLGVDTKKLLRQFGVVSTKNYAHTWAKRAEFSLEQSRLNPGWTPDDEFRFFEVKKQVAAGYEFRYPSIYFTLNATDLIDRSFWHESFGDLEVRKSGELAAKPGSALHGQRRDLLLAEINQAWDSVKENHGRFDQLAKAHGRQDIVPIVANPYETLLDIRRMGAQASDVEKARIITTIEAARLTPERKLSMLRSLVAGNPEIQSVRDSIHADTGLNPDNKAIADELAYLFDALAVLEKDQNEAVKDRMRSLIVDLMDRLALRNLLLGNENLGKDEGKYMKAVLQELAKSEEGRAAVDGVLKKSLASTSRLPSIQKQKTLGRGGALAKTLWQALKSTPNAWQGDKFLNAMNATIFVAFEGGNMAAAYYGMWEPGLLIFAWAGVILPWQKFSRTFKELWPHNVAARFATDPVKTEASRTEGDPKKMINSSLKPYGSCSRSLLSRILGK